MKIKEEDLGQTETDEETGDEIGKHERWAIRLNELGKMTDPDGGMIDIVYRNLPTTLAAMLGANSYGSWDDLCTAIKRIPADTLGQRREQTGRLMTMQSQIDALSHSMTNWNVGRQERGRNQQNPQTDNQAQFRGYGQTTPTMQQGWAPGRTGYRNQQPWATAPSTQSQTTPTDQAPNLQYSTDPPNADANGRDQYRRNMEAYERKWGVGTRPTTTNPLPLSPGTEKVGRGECFRCGRITIPRHTAAACQGPFVPTAEYEWRRNPVHRTPRAPVAVRRVEVTDWRTGQGLTVDEWLREQSGNGSEPSA